MNNYNNYYKPEKISKNNNFNNCNYKGKVTPNELYNVYDGFIRGNLFPNLYNKYKAEPYDVKPMNEQAELLTYIDAYGFALHDINLYLDIYSNDKEMISLFNSFSHENEKLLNEYQSKYGPLLVDNNEKLPWSWNESPWPWEN